MIGALTKRNSIFLPKNMFARYIAVFIILKLTLGYSTLNNTPSKQNYSFYKDTIDWYDSARNRKIPVAIYRPDAAHSQIAIISHGYNQNEGTPYLGYSFIAHSLASKGYFVVSIQHELPTDSLIPNTGIPQIVRRPFWDRGADNILFVINKLKLTHPDLDFNEITLIGHSNGGDMTALFPQKYPNIVAKIITLDNRRMALPRTLCPRVCSLRSSDFPADEGVLPSKKEIKKFKMQIIPFQNIKHNEMSDNANEEQRKLILDCIFTFLNN